MRYFFDVAHGARIVVSHASVTYVAVFHSRDSLHQPLTKSVGTAPILVVKSPDDIEKWAPLVGALARGAASLIGRGGAALGDVAVRTGEKAWGAGKGIADATGKVARGTLDRSLPYLAPGADKSIWRPGGQIVGDFMSGERGQGLANWAGETAGRISESPIGQIGRNITSQGDALREGAGKFTDKYKEGMVGVTATGGGGGSVADASAAKGAPDVTVTPEKSTQEDLGGGTVPDPVTAPPTATTTPKLPKGQTTISDWQPGGSNTVATNADVAAGNARQNLAATGVMGISMLQGRRAEARAKQEAESQRLMQERSQQGAETGGGQVAVR